MSEIFGPTVQGEGPYAGRRAMFVRLGGCNLSCSWCDTAYTWDGARFDLRREIQLSPVETIIEKVSAGDGIVVITGGEPLLQSHGQAFLELLTGLKERGREVHIESNGTIVPPRVVLDLLDVIVLSPKLANAGEHRRHQNPQLAASWAAVAHTQEVHLKIVCMGPDDVARAARLAAEHQWPRTRVWAMPEGTDAATLAHRLHEVADAAIDAGINVTSRLHVTAWGDERGR